MSVMSMANVRAACRSGLDRSIVYWRSVQFIAWHRFSVCSSRSAVAVHVDLSVSVVLMLLTEAPRRSCLSAAAGSDWRSVFDWTGTRTSVYGREAERNAIDGSLNTNHWTSYRLLKRTRQTVKNTLYFVICVRKVCHTITYNVYP